jgi:hypothetical protein
LFHVKQELCEGVFARVKSARKNTVNKAFHVKHLSGID